jgi:hypothetical protein
MVTVAESNRSQSSTTAPFERPTQAFQPPAETVAAQPKAEQRVSVPLARPVLVHESDRNAKPFAGSLVFKSDGKRGSPCERLSEESPPPFGR